MKPDDINEAEWRNPANWSWRGPLGLYFSKRDTRILVPKATPVMGWTLNFAHPACAYILIATLLLPIVLAAAVQVLS
jgi:uncharacterized membrane protein